MRASSQWDFGELFPPEATRRVLTVSELTAQVKRLVERDVGQIWVTGEVTNLRRQSSGHIYFTLKDAASQLACVLFRGAPVPQREFLEDGRKLIVQGDLTVYEPRGQYQLVIRQVEVQGVGALQVAFEKLKQRLQAAGWFAAERKRALPKYPQRIGLVTSPTGAAIRDVLAVVRRRNPSLAIVLAPCRVQGDGAAAEVAAAIQLLNTWSQRFPPEQALDLILVTRGGGSLEDLWAFNEEVVARAVFESRLPIVSAVGHEIDFTISDFVADLRAATPSAAAELITEGVVSSRQFIADAPGWMGQAVRQRLEREREGLRQLLTRVARAHPRRRLDEKLQRLDDLQSSLQRSTRFGWRRCDAAWRTVRQGWLSVRPAQHLVLRRQALVQWNRRLGELARTRVRELSERLARREAQLRLLSPDNVLERGYSVTLDAQTSAVVREAATVKRGQRLRTRLRRGEIESLVD